MAEVEKTRPIIRVEIKNNLLEESMEIDQKSEEEEGEINDDNDKEEIYVEKEPPTQQNEQPQDRTVFSRVWPHLNSKDIFTTGVNIFDKQEQEKRLERAKRFALKPDEIRHFTDDDLMFLHESLGITDENRHDVRFEAVHMLYTDNMTTEDVLQYFSKYAPTGIEWIDEKSCNVIWVEDISAARALHSISKVIRGMPVRAPCDPFAKDFLENENKENEEEDDAGRSVLLRNSNREIELIGEPKTREVELKEDEESNPRVNMTNSVDVSDITAPIPPGYWRLGEGHPKSKCILLRFAFKTDKQPYKIESFTKYYKKIGMTKIPPVDPRRIRNRGIFERNRELQHNTEKDPWGVLAKNWDEDAKFRERDRLDKNRIEVKNPGIRRRLGFKRRLGSESDSDVEVVENENVNLEKKKVKLPRMRMYADEEEEKIKRKKLLQTLKLQAEKISKQTVDSSDLRSILALTNRQTSVEEAEEEEEIDLTYDLNNPSQRMIFTVQRAIDENKSQKRSTRSHDRRRPSSSHNSHEKTSERVHHKLGSMVADREESRERERRRRHSERHSRLRSERETERSKYHRGRLHSDRERRDRHRRRDEDYYSEEEYTGKPKSKVAVVIKTQKQPTVASKVWSRMQLGKSQTPEEESESESESESDSESESESESESSESSSSSSSSSESEEEEEESSEGEHGGSKRIARPGFERSVAEKIVLKSERRSPLKIEINNDHYMRN